MGRDVIEPLEPRRLLSAAVVDGVLTISGESDVVVRPVTGDPTRIRVGTRRFFDRADVRRISITGTAGPDRIVAEIDLPVWCYGAAGRDTILGGSKNDTLIGGGGPDSIGGGSGRDSIRGSAGDDEINGGKDNDKLYGESGRNTLAGGVGNDVLVASTNFEPDSLHGNEGSDLLDGDEFDAAEYVEEQEPFAQISVSFDNVANDGPEGEQDNVVKLGRLTTRGGNINASMLTTPFVYRSLNFGDTTVRGSQGNDTITLEGGGTIHGNGGDDQITCSTVFPHFPSTVIAGDGNDTISTGIGDDQINAGRGTDVVVPKTGKDLIDGGTGRDTMHGSETDDVIYRIERFDPSLPHSASVANGVLSVVGERLVQFWISASDPSRLVAAITGVEYSFARSQVQQIKVISAQLDDRIEALVVAGRTLDVPMVVSGGAGADTIIGGGADDSLSGNQGNDTIRGMAGNDVLDGTGGEDSDLLEGGDGDDELYSGLGFHSSSVTENLFGNAGNDTLDGTSRASRLESCQMVGGAGDDTYIGDSGDLADFTTDETPARVAVRASFDGIANDGPEGENDNFLSFGRLETKGDNDVINVSKWRGFSFIYRAHGRNATYTGGPGWDYVNLHHGGTVTGAGGGDSIETGIDSPAPSYIEGGDGDDHIRTGGGNDSISGGGGSDGIFSGAGDDVIVGGGGSDRIDASDGNDRATGGDADDELIGGAGQDYLDAGIGNDLLTSNDGERDSLFGGAGDDRAKADQPLDEINDVEGFV